MLEYLKLFVVLLTLGVTAAAVIVVVFVLAAKALDRAKGWGDKAV